MKFAALSCSFFLLYLSFCCAAVPDDNGVELQGFADSCSVQRSCSLASKQQDDVSENLWDKNTDVANKDCCLACKQQDNVYEYLWDKNTDIASKTLQTDFLKQMLSGSLQAERYVSFTLQDINYLLEVTEMLRVMSENVKEPADIRDFMTNRYNSYKNFADSILNQYFLKSPPPIKPTPAMQKYLSDYRAVMKPGNDPIYFAVALLPCARLWPWLANHLNIPKTSAYYTWKTSNKEDHSEKHYKVILNKYIDTTDKVQKANTIFRMQMQNEHDFFATS